MSPIGFTILLKAPHSLEGMIIKHDDLDWSFMSNISTYFTDIEHYPNYIYYNDEVPNHNIGANYAHAKGVLLWNNDSIKWIIHSMPNWPCNNNFEFPTLKFGQSFIILDLSISNLDNIITHLHIMNVYIYNSYTLFDKLDNSYNTLDVIDLIINNLETTTKHIAKSAKWNKDIFDDYLANIFGGDIMCESWLRPVCKDTTHVDNIEIIQWPFKNIRYNETQDHSKYAFSINSSNPWVYIGDLNHTRSQSHRGGGGVLINNINIWKAFRSLVYKN
jgi:deoxyribonuclease-2